MVRKNWASRNVQRAAVVLIALMAVLAFPLSALANVPLIQISADPYTNPSSQHATQVEPDSFAYGSTIVTASQTGRFYDGGATNVCFSTSTNNGASWTSGCLPGITKYQGAGIYDRVSDPAVAYDAAHNVWMISTLAISEAGGVHGAAVLTSRSTDGGLTWGEPINTALGSDLDKNWIACDNTASSPYYGRCYSEWDNHGAGNLIQMSTSSDGGLTWGAALATANNATGLGGQPVVQPDGTVIVPIANANVTAILAFTSTNGGASWGSTVRVSRITSHTVAGSLRTNSLPSAEIDGAGKVYVVWQDCRFRHGCKANDIVMSTSTNGSTWSKVVRIPIDSTSSSVDHFIPGIAVDRSSSGSTAKLAVTYYFYPSASCTSATCQLIVGYVSSVNGGSQWSAPTQLAGPMTLSWLPSTSQGRMVGDYISTSYAGDGLAHSVFALAIVPSAGGQDCSTATPNCHQNIYTLSGGLVSGAMVFTAGADQPVPGATSDHAAPSAPISTH